MVLHLPFTVLSVRNPIRACIVSFFFSLQVLTECTPLEQDFRYSLVRLRENAESVAFYRGEDRERATIELRFDRAVKNFGNLIGWQRNLEFFTTAYRYDRINARTGQTDSALPTASG